MSNLDDTQQTVAKCRHQIPQLNVGTVVIVVVKGPVDVIFLKLGVKAKMITSLAKLVFEVSQSHFLKSLR